jgi:hypothetical protein
MNAVHQERSWFQVKVQAMAERIAQIKSGLDLAQC